ncbi:hypothetical protein CXU07_01390 [Akkermansia muciniphila]|nr:hypothetical protein [Akkermansia sp.]PNC63442.1 hypothetical protein CXU07_01390 [Akkermansia muciniphila]
MGKTPVLQLPPRPVRRLRASFTRPQEPRAGNGIPNGEAFSPVLPHIRKAQSLQPPPLFFPRRNGGHVGIDSISAHSRSTGRGTISVRFSGMNGRCSRYSIISNKARHLLLLSLMFNLLPDS